VSDDAVEEGAPVRFVYHYPDTIGPVGHMLDPGPIAEVAARAEAAGFDGFSLTEHPVPGARWLEHGGHQSLDPIVALAAAAAATDRIRLVTHLVVAAYRNPFVLAKAAATLDIVSGGRLVLGLGAGYHKAEFHALGVDFDERNELFDEVLDTLPLHWSGEPFSYRGRHFDARDVIARPRPVQSPIPIWIGGNSRLSRRRAAERAQGWMPMLGSPELSATTRTVHIASLDHLAELIAEVRDTAAAAGRTDTLDVLASYDENTSVADMERAGVTWLIVSSDTRTPSETFAFVDDFGAAYLKG
jgi:probable F420-dependent oxidoreductase